MDWNAMCLNTQKGLFTVEPNRMSASYGVKIAVVKGEYESAKGSCVILILKEQCCVRVSHGDWTNEALTTAIFCAKDND